MKKNPLSQNFVLFSSPSLTALVFEDYVNHRIFFVQPFEYNCARADFSGTKLCLNEWKYHRIKKTNQQYKVLDSNIEQLDNSF